MKYEKKGPPIDANKCIYLKYDIVESKAGLLLSMHTECHSSFLYLYPVRINTEKACPNCQCYIPHLRMPLEG